MQTITEKTIINAPPEKIWSFLINLDKDDNYKKWHPKDHILFKLLKGGDMGHKGSEAYFEEHIGKFTLKLRYRLTKAKFPEYLEYEAAFPLSLLRAGTSYFKIEPLDAQRMQLTAYLEYGYRVPIIGTLIDVIVSWFVDKKDAERHIHEEGENLKALLER